MATLKDVARLANCDVSTVSRALNNTSYVHPDTKARILEAVKELNYHPNVITRSLHQGKRRTIGVIVPKIQLSVFGDVILGIQQEARKNGYATLISSCGEDEKLEKDELNRLREGFVDGLIIAGTGKNTRLLRDIHAGGIAMTQIVRFSDNSISSVDVDYELIGYQATQYMISKGCRQIGLINGPDYISPYKGRLLGYKRAMKENDLDILTVELPSVNRGTGYGHDCAEKLLDMNSMLDGILTATDGQGLGALRALKENGIRVPEQMKVISMTGHEIGKMLETTLTSMELPAIEIGETAVRITLEEITCMNDANLRKTRYKPKHVTLEATLEKRDSSPLWHNVFIRSDIHLDVRQSHLQFIISWEGMSWCSAVIRHSRVKSRSLSRTIWSGRIFRKRLSNALWNAGKNFRECGR